MTFQRTIIQERAIELFGDKTLSRFLLYGGSRSGKSFIILFTMIVIAAKFADSRQVCCRFRLNAIKKTLWADTLPKVLKMCFPHLTVKWNNEEFFIKLPNGSEIWFVGLDDKERVEKILGMEFLNAFFNEASQISYEAYTMVLTRLAQKIEGARNLLFVDENPPGKKHWTYQVFVDKTEPETKKLLPNPHRYATLKMNPVDNMENISPEYLEILQSMPERKQKRFLRGEFGDDSEGALWSDEMLAMCRVPVVPPLRRIVIAIDPAVTSKDTSDETGIVAAGVGFDNHFYLLEDATGTYTPTEWSQISVGLYRKWKADRVIGESNNGGELIEAVLRTAHPTIPYKSVHATRDKFTRAEPVAALYEPNQKKAHHVGDSEQFQELEAEMTSWEGRSGQKSPNRIDALVWAAAELMPEINSFGRTSATWAYNFG